MEDKLEWKKDFLEIKFSQIIFASWSKTLEPSGIKCFIYVSIWGCVICTDIETKKMKCFTSLEAKKKLQMNENRERQKQKYLYRAKKSKEKNIADQVNLMKITFILR